MTRTEVTDGTAVTNETGVTDGTVVNVAAVPLGYTAPGDLVIF